MSYRFKCESCVDFFNRFKHNPDGECDCPKCQGYCTCERDKPAWGKLTKEQQRDVIDAMRITWDAIALDIFYGMKEMGETPEMKQDEVIEIVLDADHIRFNGDVKDKDLLRYFDGADYEELKSVGKKAFPHRVYGL